jgi:hypothetical protein
MSKSPKIDRSPPHHFNKSYCSDYKEPNECNSNVNCYYDYDEKHCMRKRSPRILDHSPYYNVSEDLSIPDMKNIYSFLYTDIGNQRLIELYPHNPEEIIRRIKHTPNRDGPSDLFHTRNRKRRDEIGNY